MHDNTQRENLPYGASDSVVVALGGPDLLGLEPMAKS